MYRFLPETGTAPNAVNWLKPPPPPAAAARFVSATSRAEVATASTNPRDLRGELQRAGRGGRPKGISRGASALGFFFRFARGGGGARPEPAPPPRDHRVREPSRQDPALFDERLDDEPEVGRDRLVVPDEKHGSVLLEGHRAQARDDRSVVARAEKHGRDDRT